LQWNKDSITPSLKQDVEHVTPWMDLPHFECRLATSCQFTNDTLVMHNLCSDILEQVTNMLSSLYMIAVGALLSAQPASNMGKLAGMQAIQLRTRDQNLIFQICAFFSSGYGFKFGLFSVP